MKEPPNPLHGKLARKSITFDYDEIMELIESVDRREVANNFALRSARHKLTEARRVIRRRFKM
jgi:hypothetical protein